MKKAVIFDLYETLITEYDPEYKLENEAEFSLEVDPIAFDREWKKRKSMRMRGKYPTYQDAIRDMLAALGTSATEKQLNELYKKRAAAKAKPFMNIDGGILEMLDKIKATGFKIGLISDCAPEEVAAWPDSVLPPFFDDVIFSCRVSMAKPDRGIYHLSCEKLGVSPSEAVYIGDGGSDELNGAFRAGLTPYQATWFLNEWPNAEEKKNNRFQKVHKPSEVPDLILNES
ncbi:MAG TPA: HAD-IA family hydrolase [Bacillales bacterium]|nr:HAD-IA family hydrolase [Bacillales bacterium]